MSPCAMYAVPSLLDWEDDPPRCGKPAVVVLRTGCAHEHVTERPVCADHETAMRARGLEGVFCCKNCLGGPRPHECPLSLKWAPLEAAA